jgi:hypothetical protein
MPLLIDAYRDLPNGWRLSRLSGCAGPGSSIYQKPKDHTNEDLIAKAKSDPTSGWVKPEILIYSKKVE